MDNHFKNMRPEFIERMQEKMREARNDSGDSAEADVPSPPKPTSEPTTPEEFRANFRVWIADDGIPWRADQPMGASCVLHHSQTFWKYRQLPNIHLFHYADLSRDLEGEMRRLAGVLGIDIDESLWPGLVEAATFEKMKDNTELLVPEADKDMWNNRQRFFHKGKSKQWRGILGDEEQALYRAAMNERLDPELARWIENGRA